MIYTYIIILHVRFSRYNDLYASYFTVLVYSILYSILSNISTPKYCLGLKCVCYIFLINVNIGHADYVKVHFYSIEILLMMN